jgi:hypothetical protein
MEKESEQGDARLVVNLASNGEPENEKRGCWVWDAGSQTLKRKERPIQPPSLIQCSEPQTPHYPGYL